MIGYYVHHQGRGHLQRAVALAGWLSTHGSGREEVSVLSSLPRAPAWQGEWVHLAADDTGPAPEPTAGGRLHWAPMRDDGLRSRTAAVSAWIEARRPTVLVVDVSVEIALLARLRGIPVVGVVLPGRRNDPAHDLGFAVASELVSFWPEAAVDMLPGLSSATRQRVRCLGALSQRTVPDVGSTGSSRRVVLLTGAGGHDIATGQVDCARRATPGWEWTVLGPGGTWVEDPMRLLAEADVVVTHAGQNALAEVATARRPAIVLPQSRPHDEQTTTGRVLARLGLPAVVLDAWPDRGWPDLLDRAAGLDGQDWVRWCDGGALERFARVVLEVARRPVLA